MNKQTITTILLALVTMTGQAQSQQQEEQNQDTTINWKLEGTVDNAEPTDTLFRPPSLDNGLCTRKWNYQHPC